MVAHTRFLLAYPEGSSECHNDLNCNYGDYTSIYCPVIYSGVEWDKCTGNINYDNCIRWI